MANLSNINNNFIVTDGGDVMINNTIAGYPNGEGLTVKSSNNICRVVLQNSVSGGSVNDGFRVGLIGSNVEFENTESGEFQFYTGGAAKMIIDTSGNATFAGDVTATANYSAGNSKIIYKAQRSGGAVAGDWSYDDATTDMSLGTSTAHSFSLKTGNTRALTINSSQNATFAGTVIGTTARFDTLNNNANTNNLIYRNSSGAKTVVGGGPTPDKIYILDGGNVGIGASSPGTKLEVKMNDTANNRLGFTGDGSTTGSAMWTNWQTGNSYLDFRLGGTTDTYTKMRITSDGNVLIGQTGAVGSSLLQVTGNSTFEGDLTMSSGAINSKNLLFSVATLPANNTPSINLRNSNNEFYWQMGTANTLNIVDYNYRNTIMGIAQTSTVIVANPSAANIQNPVLFLKTNVAGYNAGISFINNGNTNSYNDLAGIASFIDSGNAKGRLEFWTRNTDGANTDVATRMTIKASGNVGIGTTSPTQKLDVDGQMTHDGLVMKSGDGVYIDRYLAYTINISLIAFNWVDTGIYSNSGSYQLGASGTYAVQIYSDSHAGEPYWYNAYWSGIMSWYQGSVNQNAVFEIPLTQAAHSTNNRPLELRIQNTLGSGPGTPTNNARLEVKTTAAGTNSVSLFFRFRRLI